jgi:phosphatidate phosphatase APP1
LTLSVHKRVLVIVYTPHRSLRIAIFLAAALFALPGASYGSGARPAKQAWIDAFSGWASPTTGQLFARVHHGQPLPKPEPGQSTYRRLKRSMEELELDALSDATVSVEGVPGIDTAKADKHGFISVKLPSGLSPGILTVTLNVTSEGWTSEPATLKVMVFDDSPGVGVISDIDDTLINSKVTDKLKLLKGTLLNSSWTITTFPDAPETVTALAGKDTDGLPKIPLFYLSGSPWGLHSRISDFFDRLGFPHGAMILRRYSQEPLDPQKFKYPHLVDIYKAFPHKTWILLGDSGERDPEVYAAISEKCPEHKRAEYIHLVTKELPSSKRFAGAKVFQNWSEVKQGATSDTTSTESPVPVNPCG